MKHFLTQIKNIVHRKKRETKEKEGGGVGSLLVCNPGHGVKLLEQCICTARSTPGDGKVVWGKVVLPVSRGLHCECCL